MRRHSLPNVWGNLRLFCLLVIVGVPAFLGQAVASMPQAFQARSGYAAARDAPLILMHGMAGARYLADVLEYFYGIEAMLEAEGYRVFRPEVAPFATSERRALEAAAQIEAYMTSVGVDKVHLVGHSQGGIDARYLVGALDFADRVLSVTTIASPHGGTAVVDGIEDASVPWLEDLFFDAWDAIAGWATESEADFRDQLHELSRRHMRDVFARAAPNHPDVDYFSIGARTQANPWTDLTRRDLVNPLFLASHLWLRHAEGENDGLVSVASARWGNFLGVVEADHLDVIGLFPWLPKPSFDAQAFYRELAAFLVHGDPMTIPR